jgi:hypothetical protein
MNNETQEIQDLSALPISGVLTINGQTISFTSSDLEDWTFDDSWDSESDTKCVTLRIKVKPGKAVRWE